MNTQKQLIISFFRNEYKLEDTVHMNYYITISQKSQRQKQIEFA